MFAKIEIDHISNDPVTMWFKFILRNHKRKEKNLNVYFDFISKLLKYVVYNSEKDERYLGYLWFVIIDSNGIRRSG